MKANNTWGTHTSDSLLPNLYKTSDISTPYLYGACVGSHIADNSDVQHMIIMICFLSGTLVGTPFFGIQKNWSTHFCGLTWLVVTHHNAMGWPREWKRGKGGELISWGKGTSTINIKTTQPTTEKTTKPQHTKGEKTTQKQMSKWCVSNWCTRQFLTSSQATSKQAPSSSSSHPCHCRCHMDGHSFSRLRPPDQFLPRQWAYWQGSVRSREVLDWVRAVLSNN